MEFGGRRIVGERCALHSYAFGAGFAGGSLKVWPGAAAGAEPSTSWQERRQTARILGEPGIAYLQEAEHALQHPDRSLDFGDPLGFVR